LLFIIRGYNERRRGLRPSFFVGQKLTRRQIRILEVPQKLSSAYQLQVSFEVCSMVSILRNPTGSW
jgi:hypothetical protein